MSKAESPHLAAARQLLAAAEGNPLNMEEREQRAIKLATLLLQEINAILPRREKVAQKKSDRLLRNPVGKAWLTTMLDQSFRSNSPERVANQLIYLLRLFNVPSLLSLSQQLRLYLFQAVGGRLPKLATSLFLRSLYHQLEKLLVPRNHSCFTKHLKYWQERGAELMLARPYGAVLGEKKADQVVKEAIEDLQHPLISSISVKIDTLYLPFCSIDFEENLSCLAHRLRLIYRAALRSTPPLKYVNLDMDHSRHLYLAKELFMRVLAEEEFHSLFAGITLQAYLPDSHAVFEELTHFAINRVKKGGAPIKVRLTKGGSRLLEQVEASLASWPQAPYLSKLNTDANYKHLLLSACEPKCAKALYINVASHNLFDLSFALILRAEHRLEKEISLEMLSGMADHFCRVFLSLPCPLTLYSASANKETFSDAIGYVIRCSNERTEEDHFLNHREGFGVKSKKWFAQLESFSHALNHRNTLSFEPRKKQNRFDPPTDLDPRASFEHEPFTDFSLPHNYLWAEKIIADGKQQPFKKIPLIIDNKSVTTEDQLEQGSDPSRPEHPLYSYSLARSEEIDLALKGAKTAEVNWQALLVDKRSSLFKEIAKQLRLKRADLIGAIIADTGKSLVEADREVSEAVNFVEYYLRSYRQLTHYKDLKWKAKGTLLISSLWNFPISLSTSSLCAALLTGNCVLFKPSKHAVLAPFELCQLFWEAGIPKNVLQFIQCSSASTENQLIQDKRLNGVILSGEAEEASDLLELRPDLPITAEINGQNSMIITALADRKVAIKDLVESAFSYSGQKQSTASLAIIEGEVYDDLSFQKQLRDAASSLNVGSAWDLASFITPLISPLSKDHKKALTSLESGESWLLKPIQDPNNPSLFSPGIKWGVQKKNLNQQATFFIPLLRVIRAEHLNHAIDLANAISFSKTAGLHSLDVREQKKWKRLISASNNYINRPITGAIVQRQPFGGHEKNGFGQGLKVGGPNYLMQMMHVTQEGIPKEKLPLGHLVNNLTRFLEKFDLSAEDLGIWYASISSYAFFWQQFKRKRDISKLIGEDNYLFYRPQRKMTLRITPEDRPIDYLRAFAAALTCEVRLEVSWEKSDEIRETNWEAMLPIFKIVEEDKSHFSSRIGVGKIKRIRMLHQPDPSLFTICAKNRSYLDYAPVLANGRIELLHYLREISLSSQYHRYGNLGPREGELRRATL